MEDNLAGGWRAFGSAISAVRLAYIEPLKPLFRAVLQQLTAFALSLARMPKPIRTVVAVGLLLVTGLAALAVVAGSVGVAILGFAQASAIARASSLALSASGVPLTGFFNSALAAFGRVGPLQLFSQALAKIPLLFGGIIGAGQVALVALSGIFSGIGTAIAGAFGIAATGFLPILIGLAAVVAAIVGLYFAFKNNLFGIRTLATEAGLALRSLLSSPIAFIEGAWQRLIDRLGNVFGFIIKPAAAIAQKLISLLNHSPTEQIPRAWEGAIERIVRAFDWLLEPAKAIAAAVSFVVTSASSFASQALGAIARAWHQAGASIQGGLSASADTIGSAWRLLAEGMRARAEALLAPINRVAAALIEVFGQSPSAILLKLWGLAITQIGRAFAWLAVPAQSVLSVLVALLSASSAAISSFFVSIAQAWQWFGAMLAQLPIAGWAASTGAQLLESLGQPAEALAQAWQWLQSVFAGIFERVWSLAQLTGEAIAAVLNPGRLIGGFVEGAIRAIESAANAIASSGLAGILGKMGIQTDALTEAAGKLRANFMPQDRATPPIASPFQKNKNQPAPTAAPDIATAKQIGGDVSEAMAVELDRGMAALNWGHPIQEAIAPDVSAARRSLQLLGLSAIKSGQATQRAFDTFSLDELQHGARSFGDALETAGKEGASAFWSMTLSAVGFGIAAVASLSPALVPIIGIGLGILAITSNFLGLRSILKGLIEVVRGAISVLGGIIEILGALARSAKTTVEGIIGAFKGIPAALRGDFSQVKRAAALAWRSILTESRVVQSGVGRIFEGIAQSGRGLLQAVRGLAEGIQSAVKGIFTLLGRLSSAAKISVGSIGAAFERLSALPIRIREIARESVGGWQSALARWRVTSAMFPEAVAAAFGRIARIIRGGATNIVGAWRKVGQVIGARLPVPGFAPFQKLEAGLRGIVGAVVSRWRSLRQFLAAPFALSAGASFHRLEGIAQTAIASIGQRWGLLAESLPALLVAPAERVTGKVKAIASDIYTALKGASEKIEALWRGLSERILAPLNAVTEKAKGIGKRLVSLLAENSPGPTFLIRQKWQAATEAIASNLAQLANRGDKVGARLASSLGDRAANRLRKFSGGVSQAGILLSNFSPALAGPLFLMGDFLDAGAALADNLPKLKARLEAAGGAAGILGKGMAAIKGGVSVAVSAVASMGAAIVPAFSAIASAAAIAWTSIIAPALPFIAIGAALIGAVILLRKAFQSNFLGIRSVVVTALAGIRAALSLAIAPIHWLIEAFVSAGDRIRSAWQGFKDWFDQAMSSLPGMAVKAGLGLINALNHSPTEQIPRAWQKAAAKIAGSIEGMSAAGAAAGAFLNDALAPRQASVEVVEAIPKAPLEASAPTATTEVLNVTHIPNVLNNIPQELEQFKRSAQVATQTVDEGLQQVSEALDRVSFAEISDRFEAFRQAFRGGLEGIISGFNSASLSVSIFGAMSLTAISPVVLIAGGLALAVLAIVTNFLGLRTIAMGVLNVVGGLVKIVMALVRAFWELGKAARLVISGLFKLDLGQIKAGLAKGKAALVRLVGDLGKAIEQVFTGLGGIIRGVFEGIAQIIGNPIARIKAGFALLGNAIKLALMKPKQAWESFIALLERIRAKVAGVVDAIGDSAIGRAAKAIGLRAPSPQEVPAGKSNAFDAVAQAKPAKPSFFGRVFGRRQKQLPAAPLPEAVQAPAASVEPENEIARLRGVGAVADAASNSLAGFGNVLSFVSPALGGALFGFSSLFDSFMAIGSSIPVLKSAVIGLIPALAAQGAMAEAVSWAQIWGATKAAIANKWSALSSISVMGLLQSAYLSVANLANWSSLTQTMGAIKSAITNKWSALSNIGAMGLLSAAYATVANAARWSSITQIWGALKASAATLWSAITTTGAATMMSGAFTAIATTATVAWTAVLAPILPIIAAIGAVVMIVGLLWLAFKKNFGGIGDAVMRVWAGIKAFYQGLWEAAKGIIGSVGVAIQQTFSEIWGAIKEIGAVLLLPFKPLLSLFDGGAGKGIAAGLSRVLLLPLRVAVDNLKLIVRIVGVVIKAVLALGKALAFVVVAPALMLQKAIAAVHSILKAIAGVVIDVLLAPFRFIRDTVQSVGAFLGNIPIIGSIFNSDTGKPEKVEKFAKGGVITGPGTSIGDKVLAAVSPGEFVVKASSVAENLGLLQAINAGASIIPIPPPPLLAPESGAIESATEEAPVLPPITFNVSFEVVIQGAEDAKDVARRLAEEAYPQFQRMVRDCLRDLVDKSK